MCGLWIPASSISVKMVTEFVGQGPSCTDVRNLGYVNTGLTTLKAATERLTYNCAERLEIIRFVFFMEKNHGILMISWIQTFYQCFDSYYSKYWTMRCTTGNPQRACWVLGRHVALSAKNQGRKGWVQPGDYSCAQSQPIESAHLFK